MNTATPIVSAVLATLMAGCVSVLPEPTAPDALYTIEASSDMDGLMVDLIVREPEAPRLIAGQGMVSAGADGALRLIPSVEWSGPATRQIQLAMIDSFKTGDTGNAVLPELGIFADYELASQVSVLRMEGDTAICKMVVSVIASKDRSLLARTEIFVTQTAASNRSKDRALALRDTGSKCASEAGAFAIKILSNLS